MRQRRAAPGPIDDALPTARRRPPPRWLEAAVLGAGAVLLLYPLHVPYQVPDQDFPVTLSLFDYVRGGWSPISMHFPTALPNLLRAAYDVALAGANLAGGDADRIDLLAAWPGHHRLFRIAPRAIGMLAGVLALVAVRGLAATVAGRWTALAAMALLATAPGFVREMHHGMFDAPPAAAVAGMLWACAVHVREGSRGAIATAGALLGAAAAFKQNSAIAGIGLVAALVAAPCSWRRRAEHAALAGLAGLGALLVLSPSVVLEPMRFAEYLRLHLTLLYAVDPTVLEASPPPYPLSSVLWNAVGPAGLLLAACGLARAAVRRERGLVPLVAFALVYAAIAAKSRMVLNRYALPLLPCVAVLAAYGLGFVPRLAPRLALVALVVALQLRPTLSYLRLVATEDTRVAAASWLRANVAAADPVFQPGGPLWAAYVAPDLPRPPRIPKQIDDALAAEIRRRLRPAFPREWQYARSVGRADGAPLAPYAGAVVVTAEHPSPRFARVVTPAALVRALEGEARLLADFPIEAEEGAERVYEPGDLNFAPVAGAATLQRPGPRIRIWRVAPLPARAAPEAPAR